jgi:hypothetical protein
MFDMTTFLRRELQLFHPKGFVRWAGHRQRILFDAKRPIDNVRANFPSAFLVLQAVLLATRAT